LQLIALGLVPLAPKTHLLIARLLSLLVLQMLNALLERSTIAQPLKLPSLHSAQLLQEPPNALLNKTPGATLSTPILVLLTRIIAL